jgi:GTPase
LHRDRRRRAPWPVVALVGYTNAGKSTLFNRLSDSAVMAEDLLFATLDPTMRQIPVEGLGKVILSDTVGFVSDLPTQLVAAFRATLEEVEGADLLLHVRDISHPDSEAQRDDVLTVLGGLGIGPKADPAEQGRWRAEWEAEAIPARPADGPPIIEVHNKIDMLNGDARAEAIAAATHAGAVPVSALTGEGTDALLARLTQALGGSEIERDALLSNGDGATLAWLHRNSRIISTMPEGDHHHRYRIALSAANNARLTKMLAGIAK